MRAVNKITRDGNARDVNRFLWNSPAAYPNSDVTSYDAAQGRNTVWYNAMNDQTWWSESSFEPGLLAPTPRRDQSVKINHIKLNAVVQPLDDCIENSMPSNYPATLTWALYPMRTPAPSSVYNIATMEPISDPTEGITRSLPATGLNNFSVYDIIECGVVAISPHRQWTAQDIQFDPPVYEVNEETEAGVTEGLLTPVPPVNSLQFPGWYAGGDATKAKIDIDVHPKDLYIEKDSIIVLEYCLECETNTSFWFLTNTGLAPQAAVKVNGVCSVNYTVN